MPLDPLASPLPAPTDRAGVETSVADFALPISEAAPSMTGGADAFLLLTAHRSSRSNPNRATTPSARSSSTPLTKAPTKAPRAFENANHDTLDNHAAWMALLEAIEQEDALALRDALRLTKGSIEPVGPAGGVRKGPLCKRVLALLDQHVEFALFAFRHHRIAPHVHYPQSLWQGTTLNADQLAWLAHPGLFAQSLALDCCEPITSTDTSTVQQRVVESSQHPEGDAYRVRDWMISPSPQGHAAYSFHGAEALQELFQPPTLSPQDALTHELDSLEQQRQQARDHLLQHLQTDDHEDQAPYVHGTDSRPPHRVDLKATLSSRLRHMSVLSAFFAGQAARFGPRPHCHETDFVQARKRVCTLVLLDAMERIGTQRLGDPELRAQAHAALLVAAAANAPLSSETPASLSLTTHDTDTGTPFTSTPAEPLTRRLSPSPLSSTPRNLTFSRTAPPFLLASQLLKGLSIFAKKSAFDDKTGLLIVKKSPKPHSIALSAPLPLNSVGEGVAQALCEELQERALREQWNAQAWSHHIRRVLLGSEQLNMGPQVFCQVAALFWTHQPQALLPLHRDDAVRLSSLFQRSTVALQVLSDERMGQWIALAPGAPERHPEYIRRPDSKPLEWTPEREDWQFWEKDGTVALPSKLPPPEFRWTLIDWAPLFERPGIAMEAVRHGARLSPHLIHTVVPTPSAAGSGSLTGLASSPTLSAIHQGIHQASNMGNNTGNNAVNNAMGVVFSSFMVQHFRTLRQSLERIELEQERMDSRPSSLSRVPVRRL